MNSIYEYIGTEMGQTNKECAKICSTVCPPPPPPPPPKKNSRTFIINSFQNCELI